MSERVCGICGWILNDEHVFNVNCVAANAEAEQVETEAHEAMEQQPADPALTERAMEVVRDVLALARFKRNLRP